MMKKTYEQPQAELICIRVAEAITASDVYGTEFNTEITTSLFDIFS